MLALNEVQPTELYQRLRDQLEEWINDQLPRGTVLKMPTSKRPPQSQCGADVDLHLCTFLNCIFKYSNTRKIEFDIYRTTKDVMFILRARYDDPNILQANRGPQRFILPLMQTLEYGVFARFISDFRRILHLNNDTEFFQILPHGNQR